jgi:hypothetical protein
MPKYRNDNADEKTIFAAGKAIEYGQTEALDEYVYDPDLVLVSHYPAATQPLDPKLSKLDILAEGDLSIAAGEEKKAGPFNMQAFDFGAARSFGLLVEAGGPGNAELTVNVHAARAETSGESWPFGTAIVPISGEAPSAVYRTFDLEQCDAIVFVFDSQTNDTTITEAQLVI